MTADLTDRIISQGRARDHWEQALRIHEAIEHPAAQRVRGWLAALEESDTDTGTG